MIGHKIIWKSTVNSTNKYLQQLPEKNNSKEEGLTVVAFHQSHGKGIDKNKWESEIGKNLTFSFLIFPSHIKADEQFLLNQIISLGIIDYLQKKDIPDLSIKWPNDIYVNDKKIAGILINLEIINNHIQNAIIGIGLNINQTDFGNLSKKATSLAILLKKEYLIERELILLLDFIDKRYTALTNFNQQAINDEYLLMLYKINQWADFIYEQKKIKAKIVGITNYGQLHLITTNYNQFICNLKEIEFL